jgi:hypothetical protein
MADPGTEAALFFAAFDGLCQHFALDPQRYPLEERTLALVGAWVERMPTEARGEP